MINLIIFAFNACLNPSFRCLFLCVHFVATYVYVVYFFVNLNEVRNWWWDNKIADLKVSHEIKYDSLKKVYEIRLSSQDEKVVLAKDFDQAKRLMAEIVGLKVTELRNLHRGNRYQINMMAELDTIKLPFYFHYVFFFLVFF